MTIDVSEDLAAYPLDRAVQQLEVRAGEYGSLFRCISCRSPLDDQTDQAAVVAFDPHLGHNCGEAGPVLAGLTHGQCRTESVFPYNQKDLPRFIHHQHGFYGRRLGDGPSCVAVSTLLFDVVWVQPDGSTEEPWLSASVTNGSTRIDTVDELAGRIPAGPNGWVGISDSQAAVTIGGQTVFDFELEPSMGSWLADAVAQESMLFIQTSLQPKAIADLEANAILEPDDLDRALTEVVEREPMAAVSLPVRTATSPGKGAGRNDTCPCLSGTKFKRCCG